MFRATERFMLKKHIQFHCRIYSDAKCDKNGKKRDEKKSKSDINGYATNEIESSNYSHDSSHDDDKRLLPILGCDKERQENGHASSQVKKWKSSSETEVWCQKCSSFFQTSHSFLEHFCCKNLKHCFVQLTPLLI